MPLPANVSYGKVIGRYVLAVGDGADVGSNPDSLPAVGTATFTASASPLLDLDSDPPATIVPQAVVCTFDENGDITDPDGNLGVYLVATDSLNPEGWTWRVTLHFDGHPTPMRFSFELPTDEIVDLTEVTPVPAAKGTFYRIGPAGPPGADGTADDVVLTELVAPVVDASDEFRLIMFSNGTVKAIPATTPDPVAPTGLAATPKIASVRLAWTAATTPAASYDVYRDGSKIGSSTGLTFRDSAVTPGATYSYRVRTVDSYGQTSALTAAVTAFIDPALNQAPTVTVTSWPALAPTNGKTLLRVCGSDVDAQVLTLALGTDSGLLEPTDDPSIWYYTP